MAKKVTWLELFFDLIFVAAIAKATHVLLKVNNEVIPFEYLLKFVLMFVPIWWAWVGQSLFMNRFGVDTAKQRLFMIIQMFFVLLMTASLHVDFDKYYLTFLIGYVGIRFLTSLQYFWIRHWEKGVRKQAATYLGYGFLIGIFISLCSLFFDSWMRYLILYAGIFIDVLIPVIGRKYLKKVPAHIEHLLERFGLFTIILFGESIVSLIVVLNLENPNWRTIAFAFVSYVIVIIMWWQYYDNLEEKLDKKLASTGQSIIYGHLFICLSLSVIAALIQLSSLYKLDYRFLLVLTFSTVFLYVISTTWVFHKYRLEKHRIQFPHLALLIGLLTVLFIFNFILVVPPILMFVQLSIFFLVFKKVT
ncbi:Low temperature requirement protein LtrA [Seinonella peptonophila]|uniref:Low temperature requirement protein LtrA n=1 Tax=Seinonella peptonophila TaxID=112248 RepID=A0A1M4YAU5_9BACL|nr:low temperature requirement protein A [Seinonella peptonophila]SHF02602.1 Low temperature requirement protein LtrA [Seinonella peptonophila]